MEWQVYKIYAFTDLHVASGDTSAPPLCLCVGTPGGEGKIFLHFSRAISLPTRPLSFHVHSNLDDIGPVCACVCGFCVLKWRVVGEGEP